MNAAESNDTVLPAGSSAATVLVTGTSSGLGRLVAQTCLTRGMNVFGISRRPTELGEGYQHLSADLGTEAGVAAVTELIARIRPWGLVNNAADPKAGLLVGITDADVTSALTVNLLTPARLARAAARTMAAGSGGRIVNVSSIIANRPARGLSIYAASKAGLDALTSALAREVARRNVLVNAVAPGWLDTPMTAELDERYRIGNVPLQMVADTICDLLNPAHTQTGQIVTFKEDLPCP